MGRRIHICSFVEKFGEVVSDADMPVCDCEPNGKIDLANFNRRFSYVLSRLESKPTLNKNEVN